MLPTEIMMNVQHPPMAQQIELWPIDKLVAYVNNPRKNDGAVDRMCGSIGEFGFKIPVMISHYEHGRSLPPLPVALSLEIILRVPVAFLFPDLHNELKQAAEFIVARGTPSLAKIG